MIMNWWQGLTGRERIMVSVLGAIVIFVLGFVGIYQPTLAANATAESLFERKKTDRVSFQRSLTRYQLSALDEAVAGPASDPDIFRQDIAPLAQQFGLAVSRLQPTGEQHLIVTFDNALSADLFSFLIEAQTRPGGKIISANLNSRDGETVNAVIEFQGAGEL